MVAIIDYDAGNIKSVEKAIEFLGHRAVITRKKDEILSADHVILPGVGAFGDAMEKLHRYGLTEVIREVTEGQVPFLGICLGLQLLFESSEESPGVPGLGILPGSVYRLPEEEGLKVPHIGWNGLRFPGESQLFRGLKEPSYVYFVHSYCLQARDTAMVAAVTEYGVTFHAAVEHKNIFACQFHPEKSSDTGLRILQNFLQTDRREK
ncbi:MAG: imidazole glycerol phosphate synthase subunit HisH [Lachnospiraceae bacterium]|nr:imidazole glycerol phosphate synthase subunit HisH [Lachnospiraceae bacterium]